MFEAEPPVGWLCGDVEEPVPGSVEWCSAHGIDVRIWRARGVWRYNAGDRERVKEAFEPFLEKGRLGTISKVVGRFPGQLMPKHPLPGRPRIPSQLRPDEAVVVDDRPLWHYHGSVWPEGPWQLEAWLPEYPEAAGGKLAGRPLSWKQILSPEEAVPHVQRSKDAPYDAKTGFGSHHGVGREDVHMHQSKAKYLLFGAAKRIDCHPWALCRLARVKRVLLVMEGTLKADAMLSAGEAVFSVPSVTLWDPAEVDYLVRLVRELDPEHPKPFIVIPDADWFSNPLVDREALFLRSVIRRAGADAYIAAPPTGLLRFECSCKPVGRTYGTTTGTICARCGGYLKGVDDYRGAGGLVGDLVIHGREAPPAIKAWVDEHVWSDRRRTRRAHWALEGLSLHADARGIHDKPAMAALGRVMGQLRTRAVIEVLRDLSGAFEVLDGSIERNEVREWKQVDEETGKTRLTRVRDFVERPVIALKPDFVRSEPAGLRTVSDVSSLGPPMVEPSPRWIREMADWKPVTRMRARPREASAGVGTGGGER